MEYEYTYFKLVKLTASGEKIGYYNSNLDPEDSWPSKNVDNAQVLTEDECEGVLLIANLEKKRFNLDYTIQKIGIYWPHFYRWILVPWWSTLMNSAAEPGIKK